MFIFWILIFLRNARKGRIYHHNHQCNLESMRHDFIIQAYTTQRIKEGKQFISPEVWWSYASGESLPLVLICVVKDNEAKTNWILWNLISLGPWKSITGLRGSKLALFWQSLWINKIEFKWSSSLHQIVSCVNSQFWSRMVLNSNNCPAKALKTVC